MRDAYLIALDWGTSNLRASLLDAAGQALVTRSAAGGVMAVKDGRFEQALEALCGDWIAVGGLPLVASGMVGSRQGWKEAPYLTCPATLAQAAQQCVQVPLREGRAMLHIAPGLQCSDAAGQVDVMRGEEIQIWGAGLPAGSCCVLPGTHSKWALMGEGGAITGFSTYMTGELYGLLTQHGILGRLMQFGETRADDFRAGVALGRQGHGELSHAMFAARTAGLMGRVAPEGLPDYLSGILIGAEIGGASAGWSALQREAGVTLIGDDLLCARYADALQTCGIASRRAGEGATLNGQWQLARAAGWVRSDA